MTGEAHSSCKCHCTLFTDRLWQLFLISNFRHVLNVVCFLLGNSQVSEFYVPTFRNTLSVPSSSAGRYEEWLGLRNVGLFIQEKVWLENSYFQAKLFPIQIPQHSQPQSFFIPTRLWRWNRQSVPKHWHIKFRRRGITQKKAYNNYHHHNL
jgi:hypothetical protein